MARPRKPETVQRIERNRERFEGETFKCPMCEQPRDIRVDKRGKPYIHCTSCGLQMFVRMPDGVERFARLLAKPNDAPMPANKPTPPAHQHPITRMAKRRKRRRSGADLFRGS